MEKETQNTFSTLLSVLIGLSVVAIVGSYIYDRVNTLDIPEDKETTEEVEASMNEEDVSGESTEDTEKNEDTTLEYTEEPAYEGAIFFEKLPEIEGQQAYIAHPTAIDLDNPPTVIIYNHGSITYVTTNMEDQMMVDLRSYAEYFTDKGYVFAASNQHGANWGSDEAVQDNENLIEWIEENYIVQSKINLLGFSMGGLPTLNYATRYPERLNKIALLAPTSYYNEWDQSRFESIQYTPVGIWHGNADVNVPWSLSNDLAAKAESFDMSNWALTTIDGATHWDVDTELMDDIYQFYEN